MKISYDIRYVMNRLHLFNKLYNYTMSGQTQNISQLNNVTSTQIFQGKVDELEDFSDWVTYSGIKIFIKII